MLPATVRAFIAESPIQRGPIADAVAAFAASLPEGCEVLDAGAGEAPYRPLFEHCRYRTQDWPGSVHEGSARADVVGDLHQLPVADHSFDAVVLTEVLEHVAQPEIVLAELTRISRPGARILLTVPFVGELHEEPHDHYRYTSYGLTGILERAGWVDVRVGPLTGWFGTAAHILRHQGNSVTPIGSRPSSCSRVLSFGLLAFSRFLAALAPRLDRRFDKRRALPVGWSAEARLPDDLTTS